MEVGLVTALVIASVLVLLFLGAPIFLALGFSGLLGIFLLRGITAIFQIPGAILGQVDSFVLVAVPLFILMGQVLFVTGIGRDLYEFLSRWLYRLPGGLAVASIYACAIFGAMCGVSIAAVATIGVFAIPEMLRRGYDKPFAAGSVTAAGALAMLIPPSLLFIIYGEMARVSVGKLFIGGIVPGVILATFMAIYVMTRAIKNPKLAPQEFRYVTWRERIAPLKKLWSAVLLITMVLGTIYTGIATPTEAAAMGAVGAFLIAIFVYRAINLETLKEILFASTRTTGAIMIILACAMAFSNYLAFVRIPDMICAWAAGLTIPTIGTLLIFMLILVVLGMFVDAVSVIIITTPIILPAVMALGFDPLWYGIILAINLEMAVITPPVGLNLYTLKSITEAVNMEEILKGTMPYVALEFAALVFFILMPDLVMWLPNTMG